MPTQTHKQSHGRGTHSQSHEGHNDRRHTNQSSRGNHPGDRRGSAEDRFDTQNMSIEEYDRGFNGNRERDDRGRFEIRSDQGQSNQGQSRSFRSGAWDERDHDNQGRGSQRSQHQGESQGSYNNDRERDDRG